MGGNSGRKARTAGSRGSNNAAGNSDREARRAQVWELLRRVNDEKAVRANETALLNRAERAYKMATLPPAVIGPLRCIAAYRLAHLLLRSTDQDFNRANSLFEEASAFPRLSVESQIYRVAVLERLSNTAPEESHRRELKRMRDEAFDRARKELGESFDTAGDRYGALGDRMQGGTFNLLELATYFTGLPYTGLEGRGSRLDYALERGDWVVIGPEPETSRVHLSEATAKQELEDRARASSGGEVFFRLGPDDCHWKVTKDDAEEQRYRKTNRDGLRLMALLCSDQEITNLAALEERLLTPQQDNANFRQHDRRLRVSLGRLLGRNIPAKGLYDDRSGSGGLRLSRGLVVYGAVKRNLVTRL
jgi:hypothetical protein